MCADETRARELTLRRFRGVGGLDLPREQRGEESSKHDRELRTYAKGEAIIFQIAKPLSCAAQEIIGSLLFPAKPEADMKINRAAHIPWAILALAASAGATLLYVANFYPQQLPVRWQIFGATPPGHATIGGTPLGLVFGTIAFGIFIFAALLGVRKKLPHVPIGHVQTWLRAHIWLTFLTVPLILLHSGFHLGSPMTTLLMGLYAVVMLSGIYGLILQQKMPEWMKEQLPAETVYEQIPNIRAGLCAKARELHRALRPEQTQAAARLTRPTLPRGAELAELPTSSPLEIDDKAASPATVIAAETQATENVDPGMDPASVRRLTTFVEDQLLPYLEARRGDRFRLGQAREAGEIFRYLKLRVAERYRARVEEMERWCAERRLLDLQTKMQHWLHAWLFVHVPISFLLLLLTFWHAFVTLFRY